MPPDSAVPVVSVVICTHRPNLGRLTRTLEGLRLQTFPPDRWECLLIDNASGGDFPHGLAKGCGIERLRVVEESQLGLTHARRRGCREAAGGIIVFVDDDNVLAPDYLEAVSQLFSTHRELGALGGKSLGEFEKPAPAWLAEFHSLLALRDLGPEPLFSGAAKGPLAEYPACAPIGAGMAVRAEALARWLGKGDSAALPDRQGASLSSSGDNDLVAHVLEEGWSVAYFPHLSLLHLIPSGRMEVAYLCRLNQGIQESWLAMLAAHGLRPWPRCSPLGARLRIARAWCVHRAWRSPERRIRFTGAKGAILARSRL